MADIVIEISRAFNLTEEDVRNILTSAPRRYKVYALDKRSGGKRIIAHPAKEVKEIQRWFLKNYAETLNVHNISHGYVKNRSILTNARAHMNNSFILKIDIKEFFPSIYPKDIWNSTKLSEYFTSNEQRELINSLLFWRPRHSNSLVLSIGAPTSPAISNAVMFHIDSDIHKVCSEFDAVVTRYADDFCISTNEVDVLSVILKKIRRTLDDSLSPRLRINEGKVVFSSRKHRRSITGLIITNDGKVSLGNQRKRIIRAKLHRFKKGLLDDKEIATLRGEISFYKHIEPDFILSMFSRYAIESLRG